MEFPALETTVMVTPIGIQACVVYKHKDHFEMTKKRKGQIEINLNVGFV
jgi:hypothetical protein